MSAPWWSGLVWAMEPRRLDAVLAVRTDDPRVLAYFDRGDGDEAPKRYRVVGRTAVIPIHGPLANRLSFWAWIFGGGLTYRDIMAALADADADSAVDDILLDVDSPGGAVAGADDAARAIAAAAKPVSAYISGECCSAAYWLAAQADRIAAAPTAIVGCLGTMATIGGPPDAEWQVTFISSQTPGKRADPKSEVGREQYQALVDDLAGVFIDAVARGRGVSPAEVLERYGAGRTLSAGAALAAGMIDRIGAVGPHEEEQMGKGRVHPRAEGDAGGEGGTEDGGAEPTVEELQAELDAERAENERLRKENAELREQLGQTDEPEARARRDRDHAEALAAKTRIQQQLAAIEAELSAQREQARYEAVEGDYGLVATGRIGPDSASVAMAYAAYDAEMAARREVAEAKGITLAAAAEQQTKYRIFSELQARRPGFAVPLARVSHGGDTSDNLETAAGLVAYWQAEAAKSGRPYQTVQAEWRAKNPEHFQRVFGGAA